MYSGYGTNIFYFKVLSLIKWFGKSLKDATDYYRLHHQWLPDYVKYESGFPEVFYQYFLFNYELR